jgi:hypothetical protein
MEVMAECSQARRKLLKTIYSYVEHNDNDRQDRYDDGSDESLSAASLGSNEWNVESSEDDDE